MRLIALCSPMESRSKNKVMRVYSPYSLDNCHVVSDGNLVGEVLLVPIRDQVLQPVWIGFIQVQTGVRMTFRQQPGGRMSRRWDMVYPPVSDPLEALAGGWKI